MICSIEGIKCGASGSCMGADSGSCCTKASSGEHDGDCCLCRMPTTFARLADGLGFVQKDDIFHVLKAILAAQRDYGRRDDRKQARLKYLVDEWGIDKFRTVVEQYFGKKIEPLR